MDDLKLRMALAESSKEIAEFTLDMMDKYCADGFKDMGEKPTPSSMMGSACSMLAGMALKAMDTEMAVCSLDERDRDKTSWVSTLMGTIARDLKLYHGINTKVVSIHNDRKREGDGGRVSDL